MKKVGIFITTCVLQE